MTLTLNGIIKGQRLVPVGRFAWADLLGGSIDRELFLELGRLEHTPPEIRKLVDDLKSQVKPQPKG